MSLIDLFSDNSIRELFDNAVVLLVIVLSCIQVAPVKINPWSKIARAIGKVFNGEVMEKLDENSAKAARYRIIRFDDEIRHNARHTEEHFNQILDDIKEYEDYCAAHPKFPNGKAVSAVATVKKTYEKCKTENSFL